MRKCLEELEAFKAKHGHCNVQRTSGNDTKSLGRWCLHVRQSVEKMKNNEAPPIIAGLSEDNIKCLKDNRFDSNAKKHCSFEKCLEELKACKAKHGHCKVKQISGRDKTLGRWCSKVRQSAKTMKNKLCAHYRRVVRG